MNRRLLIQRGTAFIAGLFGISRIEPALGEESAGIEVVQQHVDSIDTPGGSVELGPPKGEGLSTLDKFEKLLPIKMEDNQGNVFVLESLARNSKEKDFLFKVYPKMREFRANKEQDPWKGGYTYLPYYMKATFPINFIETFTLDGFIDHMNDTLNAFAQSFYHEVLIGGIPESTTYHGYFAYDLPTSNLTPQWADQLSWEKFQFEKNRVLRENMGLHTNPKRITMQPQVDWSVMELKRNEGGSLDL